MQRETDEIVRGCDLDPELFAKVRESSLHAQQQQESGEEGDPREQMSRIFASVGSTVYDRVYGQRNRLGKSGVELT